MKLRHPTIAISNQCLLYARFSGIFTGKVINLKDINEYDGAYVHESRGRQV